MCDTHNQTCRRKSYSANQEQNERGLLPIEVIERTVSETSKYGLNEIIPSTMGEPLLYPEFDRILEIIKQNGIKLNLTTNGTFPKHGAEGWADRLLPVLSDIKISMNGATAETAEKIMSGLNFNKQQDNVRKFIKKKDQYHSQGYDPTVTMQATYMRTNLDELPMMLNQAIEMGFDRFKGHHVWITNEAMEKETLRTDEWIDSWNDTVEELHKIANGNIILANVNKIRPGEVVNEDSICPFLGKEAWIESNGDFQVCCCPDSERSEFGDFGNTIQTNFMDIWNSKQYRDFVKNWGYYGPCKHCNMRIGGGQR